MKENPPQPEAGYEDISGVHIIGENDPRLMSRSEFDNSPDILFHGSKRPLIFSQDFDYQSEEHFMQNDGSATLGCGFYATDNRSGAETYSRVRQLLRGSGIFVATILPYQALVLDLRAKGDSFKNGSVSRAFAAKWRDKLLAYYQQNIPETRQYSKLDTQTWRIARLYHRYVGYLNRVMGLDKIDLRVLLETAPCPQIGSRNLPHPPWVTLFSEFMLAEGYDGLIYNEGGEGSDEAYSSYVFYNLKTIGTFDSWHMTHMDPGKT